MAKKKIVPTFAPDDPALISRVDAMMDPLQPDQVPAAQEPAAAMSSVASTPGSIDIFKELKTAPQLPGDLLKQATTKLRPTQAEEREQLPPEQAATPEVEAPSPIPEAAAEPPLPVSIATADDPDTDKAVDDIMAHESDVVLEAQDKLTAANSQIGKRQPASEHRFKKFLTNKWFLIAILTLLVAVLSVPLSRNALIGLVVKEPVHVQVIDSVTGTPVSGATVSIHGASAKTDAKGQATLRAPFGTEDVVITKQYYQQYSHTINVSFGSSQLAAKLLATGRQVPVTVINKITGKPISNAEIKILNATATTNEKGLATIALPTKASSMDASISAKGYNTAKSAVLITNNVVSANTITLTPAGRVYFLSDSSGKVDVVKANLDGTDKQTVLTGTGNEDKATTTLLPSHDWQYVALRAHRDGNQAALYLIDTATDKVTEFDTTNADTTLVGWIGHSFVYDLVRHTTTAAQTGHESLKSYNADTNQLNQLDQNQAEGSSTSYAYQAFGNFAIANGQVLYTMQWNTYSASGTAYDISNKSDTIRGIQPSGSGKKDYQTFDATNVTNIQASHVLPQTINYGVYSASDGKTTLYQYQNQLVSTPTDVSTADLNKVVPTYLLSPSGTQTFWHVLTGRTNSLYTASASGQNQKQLASSSEYSSEGWYTDDYILVSKNGAELYITTPSQLVSNKLPVAIGSYYKSSVTASVPDYVSQ